MSYDEKIIVGLETSTTRENSFYVSLMCVWEGEHGSFVFELFGGVAISVRSGFWNSTICVTLRCVGIASCSILITVSCSNRCTCFQLRSPSAMSNRSVGYLPGPLEPEIQIIRLQKASDGTGIDKLGLSILVAQVSDIISAINFSRLVNYLTNSVTAIYLLPVVFCKFPISRLTSVIKCRRKCTYTYLFGCVRVC